MVESGTGADLADVSVHRGPEVTAEAAQLSARAYTTGGEVHLPQEHGPLSSGTGRSLLAHELTHVAQQRALGSSLPPESSPAGARLEAEAQANEQAALRGGAQRSPLLAGTPGADPGTSWSAPHLAERSLTPQRAPMSGVAPHADPARAPTAGASPRADPARAAVAAGVGALGPDGAVHFRAPGAAATGAPGSQRGVQRAIGKVPSNVSTLPPPRRPADAPGAPPAGDQVAAEALAASPPAATPDAVAPPADAPAGPGAAAPAAPDPATAAGSEDASQDDEELEALARRLWPRLHQRIRNDLLVARERSGHLVDRF